MYVEIGLSITSQAGLHKTKCHIEKNESNIPNHHHFAKKEIESALSYTYIFNFYYTYSQYHDHGKKEV
jgi:hypothetical protein